MKSIINWKGWFGTPREKNPLAGKPLRYLIGAGNDFYVPELAVCVLPYDYDKLVRSTLAIGYCNLYWQEGAPDCAPYLRGNDTSDEYGERVIDPKGSGFAKNLAWQLERWYQLGVEYIELDNADGYELPAVISAIDLAESHGFKVIAKNPGLFYPRSISYVKRCHGIISEKGSGTALTLDQIRREAGFPEMPVWFVAWGAEGEAWCEKLKQQVDRHLNMGVTLSPSEDEYTESQDVVVPKTA